MIVEYRVLERGPDPSILYMRTRSDVDNDFYVNGASTVIIADQLARILHIQGTWHVCFRTKSIDLMTGDVDAAVTKINLMFDTK